MNDFNAHSFDDAIEEIPVFNLARSPKIAI